MLHIGGARTALFSWLAARATGGRFILRIEDTDRERSTTESAQAILEGLSWLGLDYDEGPIYQSGRIERYADVAGKLLQSGRAYRCYCPRERIERLREQALEAGEKPRYDGFCRERRDTPGDIDPVIRFRNPDTGLVRFTDRIRGEISIDNAELDDLVILRADGTPTYNFAVVVDDMDMQVDLVIRGDDHINNTPRQINIYQALDSNPPEFAHVPMILGEDGTRLSKRHGALSVLAWREQGFLPHALVNYLVRLGWSHGDQEVFSREEMIRLFDISDVNRKAARFDIEKLTWLNQHYLRETPAVEILPELSWHMDRAGLDPGSGPQPADLLAVQAERVRTLVELVEQSRPFYVDRVEIDEDAARRHLRPAAEKPLAALISRLEGLSDWAVESLHRAVEQTAAELDAGLGKVAQPARVALVGTAVSPSIDKTLWLTGRSRSLERLENALEYVRRRTSVTN